MTVAAVTFDLWETLIADSPAENDRRTAYRVDQIGRILDAAGLAATSAELENAHARAWSECSRSWERAVDLPFERQVSLFLDLARHGLAAAVPHDIFDRISNIYASAALLYPPDLIPGAVEALSQLRSRNLKLGLICNTGRTPGFVLRKLLSCLGLMPLLDVAYFSDETIVRKPDARIFRLAMQGLGTSPERSVHVGDSLENDVRGAIGSGMRTVWISRDGQNGQAVPAVESVALVPELIFDW